MGSIGEITEVKIEDKIREIITELFDNYTVQASQISPSGIDSSPLKEKQGVLIPVGGSGKYVHIGIYTQNEVENGEIKVYSEDADENIMASIYLTKDGKITIESEDDIEVICKKNVKINADEEIIINEGSDYAVKYNELETAFNQLKQDFDNFVSTTYGVHIHPAVTTATVATGPVGVVTISPTTTQGSSSTADITPAKVDEVRI